MPRGIRPELTALSRIGLSAPARQALMDGLLRGASVLDYGCGRGGDVSRLRAAGVDVVGWDPYYRPEPRPSSADVVLCSYVLNVIPAPGERADALRQAFQLAQRTLVVAVRGLYESRRLQGQPYVDGTVTSRGTFHHLYSPGELGEYIRTELKERPIAVQPGIAYIFRKAADRAKYISTRYGSSVRQDDDGLVRARLAQFLEDHGRSPTVGEQPILIQDANQAYGRLNRAIDAATHDIPPERLARAAKARRLDLLVVLALELFHGSPRLRDLPPDRQADVSEWYSNLGEATTEAERMLRAAGDLANIRAAMRVSRVGKTSPTALYVHSDAERHLPALLRLYGSCGALVAGRPAGTTLIKLSHDRAAVSFLMYPTFDHDPHPRIAASLSVDLGGLRAIWRDFSQQNNRPLLHRKEEFLDVDDPRHERFARLTRSEERAGLYECSDRIGREDRWQEMLDERGVQLRGHRLIRRRA